MMKIAVAIAVLGFLAVAFGASAPVKEDLATAGSFYGGYGGGLGFPGYGGGYGIGYGYGGGLGFGGLGYGGFYGR